VNCCGTPLTTLGVAGVTSMLTTVAAVTVSTVAPETLPSSAMIVVAPGAPAVARPFEPAALLIVAVVVIEDDHVTLLVRSCVELSE
jgi:hypothetical protein